MTARVIGPFSSARRLMDARSRVTEELATAPTPLADRGDLGQLANV